jgi:hypothetical protein
MKKCCGNCIGDAFLASQITDASKIIGDCDYCGSGNVNLVDPPELVDYFGSLFGIYEERNDPDASSLEALIRKDWGLFDRLDSVKAETLLVLIFDDNSIFHKKYAPVIENDVFAVQEWEDFREELKHRNRYFPKNIKTIQEIEKPFAFLQGSAPAKVYRARMCDQQAPYPINLMGKPPEKQAGNGRANPVGIPCLYVASDTSTAIAEIRPHKGELVCVAEFEVDDSLKLIDLQNPRKTVSPFELDDTTLKLFRRYMEYLCRLGKELTMPVLPHTAHLEYLPSQYLCEYIKMIGYDGVIYHSAMGPGINYAIFNDSKVMGKDVSLFQIDDIVVRFSDLL